MKKTLLSLSILTLGIISYAQVGIGTESPTTTLEVRKSTTNPTTVADGIRPPNMTKTELANKAATTYGVSQAGTIIYVNDNTGGTTGTSVAQVANINVTGYYFFDGSIWQKMSSTAGGDTTNDAWVNNAANTRVELGTTSAGAARTAGTEVVATDTGRFGIKTPTPNATLEVKKSSTTPTTSVDGVIPPNMTKLELANKTTGTYSAPQKSALVYVSDISGTFTGTASESQVTDILGKGYYYFDDTVSPNGRWVSLYDPKSIAIPIIYGTMASSTTGGAKNINPIGTSATPLNSYITLGPGKWLLSVNILLFANTALRNATTSPWIWARLTFNDGTTLANIQTNTTQTGDFVGSTLISGSFFSPPTPSSNGQRPTYVYSMLSGQVVINNTSGANKMYGLMWWSSESNTTETTYQFINLSSAGNGENVITAMRIQ
ncbi:hypothetical protein [Empedobacter sedimenti]|uniref:hypothetical protein n=1 Tax=Empedobacter sedimenti TaxID=3042610 RepID=UPI0024A6A965|nr:hypothetical protein [Empedobacter sedimenti]